MKGSDWKFYFFLFLMIVATTAGLSAAEEKTAPVKTEETASSTPDSQKETLSETSDSVKIDGKEIQYRALAGDILLRDQEQKPKSKIFFVAYLQKGTSGTRPITFIFNGGPGSSSVWLHLGLLGPKRVRLTPDGFAPGPPYGLQSNPYSMLDVTDLVFIDPISTGYSRALPGQESKQYHEVHRDVESVGEFIRLFLTRYERWTSPLFIAGESYGTIRGSGLVDYLQRRFGTYFNGLVFLSPAMITQTFRGDVGNDLPYILGLPAYSAAAWYYKKLEPSLQQKDLQQLIQEVENFALNRYATALLKGAEIPKQEKDEIVSAISRYTTLPPEKIVQENLRIGRWYFAENLLKNEGKQIGVLDCRYTRFMNWLPTEDFGGEYSYNLMDPSAAEIDGVFSSGFRQYIREDLKYKTEQNYEILSIPVAQSWDYKTAAGRYLNTADNVRAALTMNPNLKILLIGGYFDLVTTTAATDYIANHLNVNPDLQKNVQVRHYPGGHMMYLHEPSLIQMKQELRKFYIEAIPAK